MALARGGVGRIFTEAAVIRGSCHPFVLQCTYLQLLEENILFTCKMCSDQVYLLLCIMTHYFYEGHLVKQVTGDT